MPTTAEDWLDYSHWPGPSEWEDWPFFTFSAYVRRAGEEWQRIKKIFQAESQEAALRMIQGFKPLQQHLDELMPTHVDRVTLEFGGAPPALPNRLPTTRPRVRQATPQHVGPRSERTYDRGGRRRY